MNEEHLKLKDKSPKGKQMKGRIIEISSLRIEINIFEFWWGFMLTYNPLAETVVDLPCILLLCKRFLDLYSLPLVLTLFFSFFSALRCVVIYAFI